MKRTIRNSIYAVAVWGVFFWGFSVVAEEGTLDVQAFLPLFERNSIERKILDVSYSFNYEDYSSGKVRLIKRDVRLVFDAETEKYREEIRDYYNPNDTGNYDLKVNMWDGKEAVVWSRSVSTNRGFRAFGLGTYEYPGHAAIHSQPIIKIPPFVEFYYDMSSLPFAKSVFGQNPKTGGLSGDTIRIETQSNKFEFSKKTGALEKLVYYSINPNKEIVVWKTYEFSDHVEVSGVWMPLRIVETMYQLSSENVYYKTEFSVDPKTLRLLDKVDNPSIFNEALPARCAVNDQIRKKVYTVTTADTLPNDVEALKKALDKMLEQAQEQKKAVEAQEQEKKKK